MAIWQCRALDYVTLLKIECNNYAEQLKEVSDEIDKLSEKRDLIKKNLEDANDHHNKLIQNIVEKNSMVIEVEKKYPNLKRKRDDELTMERGTCFFLKDKEAEGETRANASPVRDHGRGRGKGWSMISGRGKGENPFGITAPVKTTPDE